MSEAEEPQVPKDPTLEEGALDRIYEELGNLGVQLDADPLVFGPKRLNGKIAQVRAQLDICESIFLQASHDLHRFNTAHRAVNTTYQVKKDWHLANDPETRAGRNVSTQEAVANMKLADLVARVHTLGAGVEDLKAALVVIKAKRADLKDAASRLRDQIKLCREEIGLGSKWGSKQPDAPDLIPSGVVPDIERIDAVLGALDGETHLTAPEDVPSKPVFRRPANMAPPEPEPEATTSEPEPDEKLEPEQTEELTSLLTPNATADEVDGFLDLTLETAKSPNRKGVSDEALDTVLNFFK